MSQLSRISQKRDSSENWELNNPILMNGEFGYDTTKKQIKIGDGVSHWNDLPFITSSEQILVESNDNITNTQISKLETGGYIISIKKDNNIKQFKFTYDNNIQIRTISSDATILNDWEELIFKKDVYTKTEIDELLANIEIGGGGTTAEDGNEVEY